MTRRFRAKGLELVTREAREPATQQAYVHLSFKPKKEYGYVCPLVLYKGRITFLAPTSLIPPRLDRPSARHPHLQASAVPRPRNGPG